MKAREGSDALVAAYKTLLRDLLDRRPSGTRQKIARALGKHKSFVSQVTNPVSPVPLPAKHLGTIFEICHFSSDERRDFLHCYAAAHPRRALSLAPPSRGDGEVQTIELQIPVLPDTRQHALLVATIRGLAQQAIALAQGASAPSKSSADGETS